MLENLRTLRAESGVTQKQLADAVGISQQSINKYENHNIEPDIETMIRIADFFHVSVDHLIGHAVLNTELSSTEARLLAQYRKLSNKQQECVRFLMQTYLE